MKNRKLYQLFIASVISATMMTSSVGVSAAEFTDAPAVEAEAEFSADAAEATADLAINVANFPDAAFRQYVSDKFDTNKDGKLSSTEINADRSDRTWHC